MSGAKKVRWKKVKRSSQEMSLNITSMADIFTIILVFLLKSFSAEGSSLTPSLLLQLPSAKRGLQTTEMLKVEISGDAINVDGKIAANLHQFEFPPGEVAPETMIHRGIDNAIAAARAKHPLPKQLTDAALVGEAAPQATQLKSPIENNITIMADHNTPYNTLKSVLASAANHGYVNYKLVVVKEEE